MKKNKDNREYTKKDVIPLKKKLLSAFTMFLVATILMTSTSYAWLVLSVAPEVTGISTNIGANGSLEMALLTTETRADLSTIRTAVGESLSQRNPSANNTWGNLVDLSYSDYGLGEIVLLPARLQINPGAQNNSVGSSLLSVPVYGFDGRVESLSDDAVMSAVFSNDAFSLIPGTQNYGVRAIGTTDTLSVQESALAMAKGNIIALTNSAKSGTNAILTKHGDSLFTIMLNYALDANTTFSDTELDALKALVNDLDDVSTYIDKALRQGIVAVAASEIENKSTFIEVRDRITDESRELNAILGDLSEVGEIPDEFLTWVSIHYEMQNRINAAKNTCNSLSDGSYNWEDFSAILKDVMNTDLVYINGTLFPEFDKSTAGSLLGGTVELVLAPGSGVFADIADFVGNYSTILSKGTTVEISTASAVDPAYLTALSNAVNKLSAAEGGASQEAVALNATYGYAIDLAFRCNAAVSDLLLQTTPEHRVYDGSENGSSMGGGSYMQFSTKDNSFGADKMIQLMDAVRVAFVDDKDTVLGIAKLNTSNREIVSDGIKAPLYLYSYTIETSEDISKSPIIVMGERLLTENTITALEQNVAKAITAIVWLDGDIVDNTMVSATEETSLNGVLNLQFASSADLVPANNTELLNITADKTELDAALTELASEQGEIALGQRNYTTVSWEAFVEAYEYAVAVSNNPNANDSQVYFAAAGLATAKTGLQVVSTEAVETKIAEVRNLMGTSENIARYVIKDADGNYSTIGGEGHTQEDYDRNVAVIYQVDYANNLNDEGNELFTQIYTDESWVALANELYNAEGAITDPNITDSELNNALTALDDEHNALERAVFYTPYEYKGAVYYEAICDANNADTYGKWYDSDFKRVVADLTILNLDAYAEPIEVLEIVQNQYVQWDANQLTPYVEALGEVYPGLQNEVIKGIHWNITDSEYYTELVNSRHIETLTQLIQIVNYEQLDVDVSGANAVINNSKATAEEARTVINNLSEEINAALDAKHKEEEEKDPYITESQVILLNAAISSAKATDGYEDASVTELEPLRTAVSAAEAVLSSDDAIKEKASAALSLLNQALKDAEKVEITEYNTIEYSIPVISEIYDVVHSVDYPGMILKLSGKTGAIELNAVVLTENGIVGRVSKIVNIYTPADRILISKGEEKDITNFIMMEGEEVSLNVSIDLEAENLSERAYEVDLGNIVNGLVKFPESIRNITWSSDDTDIATVSGGVVKAVKEGTVTIAVSVETTQGNAYTAYVNVTITAAPSSNP